MTGIFNLSGRTRAKTLIIDSWSWTEDVKELGTL